jgi:methyl-accepting chemotaxis protein
VVVADEVRHLVIRSHQLTEQIYTVIDRLRVQVSHAVQAIELGHLTASDTAERVKKRRGFSIRSPPVAGRSWKSNLQIASGAEQQRQLVEGNALETERMVQASSGVMKMTTNLR